MVMIMVCHKEYWRKLYFIIRKQTKKNQKYDKTEGSSKVKDTGNKNNCNHNQDLIHCKRNLKLCLFENIL